MKRIYSHLLLLLCIPSICTVRTFIKDVVQESNISLLMVYYDYCEDTWLHKMLLEPASPVVLQSLHLGRQSSEYFSSKLHIICLPKNNLPMKHLSIQLQQGRQEKVLFYINNSSVKSLEAVLNLCFKLRIFKVIALLGQDKNETQYYYSYEAFPSFRLLKHHYKQRPYFDNKFPNMQQEPFTVYPDQKLPRTILYTDRRTGQLMMTGSVGRFVCTLAWKLNATMKFSNNIEVGKHLHMSNLQEQSNEVNIDLLVGMKLLRDVKLLPRMSYPFEISHICLMIPISKRLPGKDIYRILNSLWHLLILMILFYGFALVLCLKRKLRSEKINLIHLLLNDLALRGVLGLPFNIPLLNSYGCSCIYLILGLLGLNLSTVYQAELGTYLTHPPHNFQLRTFADIQRAQFPLMLDHVDVAGFLSNYEGPLPLNIVATNTSELNRHRDSMNDSYVYLASRLSWTLLHAQQMYFPKDVFLYSMDGCYITLIHMSFLLSNSSWLLEPLNKLILDTRAAGLYQYYFNIQLYDMAAANLLSFADPLKRETDLLLGNSLRVEDLEWVWTAYGVLLFISFDIFVLEVFLGRLQRRWQKTKKRNKKSTVSTVFVNFKSKL